MYLFPGCAFLVSLVLTMFLKRIAGATGLLDVPNDRSSHTIPTPRGGGVAIVISSLAAMALLAKGDAIPLNLFVALSGGGVAVAMIGFLDDRSGVPAWVRLLVHFVAAAWAVVWVGRVDALSVGGEIIHLGALGYALSTIVIVWFLNIFNFMDGIDGIAASEAIFICGGVLLLSRYLDGASAISAVASVVAAASAGFLIWNWPPAKIFMGDVGSGYLGYVIAVVGLSGASHSPSGPWLPLVLAGTFVADSTVTLVRRFFRGEAIALAHRSHAYQRAAKRIGHAKVTATVAVVNLGWLLPCAAATARRPADAWWISVVAIFPLVVTAVGLGAGRREVSVSL